MASRGVNKVVILGNLGQDPTIRQTNSGGIVCTLNIATSERFRNRDGEDQERTEWHRVTVFGRLAEVCRDYLQKGSSIYMEGSLRTSTYERDGETRYSLDIIMRDMVMLGSRQDGGGRRDSGSGYDESRADSYSRSDRSSRSNGNAQQPANEGSNSSSSSGQTDGGWNPGPSSAGAGGSEDSPEDDIPF